MAIRLKVGTAFPFSAGQLRNRQSSSHTRALADTLKAKEHPKVIKSYRKQVKTRMCIEFSQLKKKKDRSSTKYQLKILVF